MATEISIIGLGAMGHAITQALIHAGHGVTVWNRTANRMQAFHNSAKMCASSVREAATASDVIIVCIDDYDATLALIEANNLEELLCDKVLVQFSTGTPEEARNIETVLKDRNVNYIDGAILAYPREIGHDALIAVSGEKSAYAGIEKILATLSSDIRYLGEAIGGAAALDIAVMSYYILTHLGLIHAALICESEDVRRDMLASVLIDSLPSDGEEIRHLGEALQNNKFENPGASVNVYSNILDRVLSQAQDKDIDSHIPEFANQIYKKGIVEGLGDQEVVSLIKLLRR